MCQSGLKRSMPSLDLSSMSSSGAEDALQVLEGRARNEVLSFSSLLISTSASSSSSSSAKRQKRFDAASPATSALEEALKQLDDNSNDHKINFYEVPPLAVNCLQRTAVVKLSSFDASCTTLEKTSWDWAFSDEHSKMFSSSKSCTNEIAGLPKEQPGWAAMAPMFRI